jgi:hypothetical protein
MNILVNMKLDRSIGKYHSYHQLCGATTELKVIKIRKETYAELNATAGEL